METEGSREVGEGRGWTWASKRGLVCARLGAGGERTCIPTLRAGDVGLGTGQPRGKRGAARVGGGCGGKGGWGRSSPVARGWGRKNPGSPLDPE